MGKQAFKPQGEWRVKARGCEVALCGEENVLKLDYDEGCTTLSTPKDIDLSLVNG